MPPRERVHFSRTPSGVRLYLHAPPCVHFLTLSHDEQAAAIRRLASLGFGDHEIAQRTGWHVIEVRRALAAHRERIDFTYAR